MGATLKNAPILSKVEGALETNAHQKLVISGNSYWGTPGPV